MHLLIALWSPVAAWLLTALSLYTVLWLIGDYRAVRLRPTLLHDGALEVRVGMRWNRRLPPAGVHAVRPAPASPLPGSTPGYLNASVVGSPNLLLELTGPLEARGPYGWRKEVTLLGLTVDDADAFLQVAAPQP